MKVCPKVNSPMTLPLGLNTGPPLLPALDCTLNCKVSPLVPWTRLVPSCTTWVPTRWTMPSVTVTSGMTSWRLPCDVSIVMTVLADMPGSPLTLLRTRGGAQTDAVAPARRLVPVGDSVTLRADDDSASPPATLDLVIPMLAVAGGQPAHDAAGIEVHVSRPLLQGFAAH